MKYKLFALISVFVFFSSCGNAKKCDPASNKECDAKSTASSSATAKKPTKEEVSHKICKKVDLQNAKLVAQCLELCLESLEGWSGIFHRGLYTKDSCYKKYVSPNSVEQK